MGKVNTPLSMELNTTYSSDTSHVLTSSKPDCCSHAGTDPGLAKAGASYPALLGYKQAAFKSTPFIILASSPGCVKRGYEQLMLNVLPQELALSLSPPGKGERQHSCLYVNPSLCTSSLNRFPRLRPKCPHLLI